VLFLPNQLKTTSKDVNDDRLFGFYAFIFFAVQIAFPSIETTPICWASYFARLLLLMTNPSLEFLIKKN
jgi:hypothetical protein